MLEAITLLGRYIGTGSQTHLDQYVKEADLMGPRGLVSRVAVSRRIAFGSLSFVSFSFAVTRGWNHGIFHCRHGHDSRLTLLNPFSSCSEVGGRHTDHKRDLALL